MNGDSKSRYFVNFDGSSFYATLLLFHLPYDLLVKLFTYQQLICIDK